MNSLRLSVVFMAFFLLLVSSFSFLSVSAQSSDPPLYCSDLTFQAYSVITGISPDYDHQGAPLSPEVVTSYGTTSYYITLSQQVTSGIVFLDLNNSQNGNVTFSIQWGLYFDGIVVNNQWITDPNTGLAKIFYFNNSGWQVELSPFTSGGAANRTYLVTVNLTQNIYGPSGPNGQTSRLDGCVYTDYFFITNPGVTGSGPAGFGLGSSSTGGAISGDPMFVGLKGQRYQVHGIDGAVYNLISDDDVQFNSRFTFLNGPRTCPVMPTLGAPSQNCWTHPGSYLGELGIKTKSGDKLSIISGDASEGFSSVMFNDSPLKVGYSSAFVSYNSTHELTFSAGHFTVVVENIDHFVNLRKVMVSDWSSLNSHGLLGQTWNAKKYSGKVKEIQGDVDDYVVLSDDLFGDEFVFNRFKVASS